MNHIKFTLEDCWILMSIPLNNEGADLTELIARADSINHAIPTQKEIEQGLTKGLQSELLIKRSDRFIIRNNSDNIYKKFFSSKGGLFALTDNLFKELKSRQFQQLNDIKIKISDLEYKSAVKEYTEYFNTAIKQIKN